MNAYSADPIFSPCLHRHVVPVTSGTRRFVEGEVTDNIQVLLQCTDCLEYVSEAEVRAAWSGVDLNCLVDETGGNEDVDF